MPDFSDTITEEAFFRSSLTTLLEIKMMTAWKLYHAQHYFLLYRNSCNEINELRVIR